MTMTDDIEVRRRRAAYRASHRGTKEMDALVGRYAEAHLAQFDEDAMTVFERFLAMPDPTLQSWIFSGEGYAATEFANLVPEIRKFHGLEQSASA